MATGAHALTPPDRSRAVLRAGVLATLAAALVWTTTSGSAAMDAPWSSDVEVREREPGSVASRAFERAPLPVTAAPDAVWNTFPQESIAVVSRAEHEAAARAAAEAIAAAEAARLAEEKAIADAAQALVDAEAKAKADAERAARPKKSPAPPRSSPVETGSVKAYASELVGGGEQFACLDALWQKESRWEHTADNPTSSAYGIPQALPGSKMASAGADWATNPRTQVRWGVSYIAGRYGTPCAAWSHSQAKNWY